MRLDRQKFHRGHAEILQIIDRPRAAESGVSAAHVFRHAGAEFRETFHVQFVDDRLMQRGARPSVVAPIKASIDNDRLRHSPGVITKIARQILFRIAHGVAEHFVRPIHFARDRFRVGID